MGRAVRLNWQDRDDGSHWAECHIGGESALVALIVMPSGGVNITAIVQVEAGGNLEIEEAKRKAERWLERV